jgi:hypothetical protein
MLSAEMSAQADPHGVEGEQANEKAKEDDDAPLIGDGTTITTDDSDLLAALAAANNQQCVQNEVSNPVMVQVAAPSHCCSSRCRISPSC